VEVVSPGQSRTEMRAKVDIYRAFGIRSSWVIDLERQTVDIYEGDERRTYSGDTPIVSGVIPALSLTAARLFDEVEGR
ncbi:MAG TPA: Uma2 family endonuclease, partial [Tepidiformaceae bacterium]|nr:Uma2 family endonuclease [Tepidiformaceae bacterium]